MSWFSLQEPVGTNWRLNTGDLKNTKRALSQLGYYKVPPERGVDDWADTQMFDGIRAFQKDNGLKVDAFMRPGGPTEKAVNQHLATALPGSNTAEGDLGSDGSIIDAFFGRRGGRGPKLPPRGKGKDSDCDRLNAVDTAKCGTLPDPAKRARCHSSASERYAACLAGRTMPPLNTGDW